MTNREPFSTSSETQNQVSPQRQNRPHVSLWETYEIEQHFFFFVPGFVVNGQIIGKKKVVLDGIVNTYIGRLGISHQKLGVRLEVSTRDISVFHGGKNIKLLWSDAVSIKETKWVRLRKYYSKLSVWIRQQKMTISILWLWSCQVNVERWGHETGFGPKCWWEGEEGIRASCILFGKRSKQGK